MSLAFGIVPPEHIDSVVAFVKPRKMACSVYGAQYLLEGLYLAHQDQYALDLMLSQDDRGWLNMIKVGSTMTMEAWDMKYKPNADWNHAWGAAPANIITRWMWGIKPLTPAFDLIQIHPQLADLQHCSITAPTTKGPVKCDYKRISTEQYYYSVTLPPDTRGQFVIPEMGNCKITLNNESISDDCDSINLQPGKNIIEIKTTCLSG